MGNCLISAKRGIKQFSVEGDSQERGLSLLIHLVDTEIRQELFLSRSNNWVGGSACQNDCKRGASWRRSSLDGSIFKVQERTAKSESLAGLVLAQMFLFVK
jgi:hypothetical protein